MLSRDDNSLPPQVVPHNSTFHLQLAQFGDLRTIENPSQAAVARQFIFLQFGFINDSPEILGIQLIGVLGVDEQAVYGGAGFEVNLYHFLFQVGIPEKRLDLVFGHNQ